MTNKTMSLFTDSLKSDYDPPLKTFLLDQLSHAEKKVRRGIITVDNAYWQGRKDAIRVVLAVYLDEPNIAELNASSTFSHLLQDPCGADR